jgi:hypothetical protein
MCFFVRNTLEQHRTFNDMLFIFLMYKISLGFSGQSILFLFSSATMFLYQSLTGFSLLGPMNFVDPSQTIFIGAFNVHSLMRLIEPL